MQVSVAITSFMCLASLSIYSDTWKSFMKFGIKKSHEMISYMLVWIITKAGFCKQGNMPYIPCELVLMQHVQHI
jgi:hypothetical protein